MQPATLIKLEDAASLVGATVRQLRTQIARGVLPASKVGRVYRVSPADVLALYAVEARVRLPAFGSGARRESPNQRAERRLAKAGLVVRS